MKQHEISLTPADLDAIGSGGFFHAMTDDGTKIVLSRESAWNGPAAGPNTYRVGISDRQLDNLGYGRSVPVITADGNATLVITVDAEAVTR